MRQKTAATNSSTMRPWGKSSYLMSSMGMGPVPQSRLTTGDQSTNLGQDSRYTTGAAYMLMEFTEKM